MTPDNSFVIVKNGDTYERLDKEYYEKYRELKSESFSEGFYGRLILNEEGNLAAGVKKYEELVVKRIDNGISIQRGDISRRMYVFLKLQPGWEICRLFQR